MDYRKEFKDFAIKHHGINSMYYDKIVSSMTPYIIEERQLNVAQMDVFSRLMMDRIMFLGTAINDSVANVIQAQLLFLQKQSIQSETFKCISIHQVEAYMPDWEFTILCSLLHLMLPLFVQVWLLQWGSLALCWGKGQTLGITSFESDDSPTAWWCSRSGLRY